MNSKKDRLNYKSFIFPLVSAMVFVGMLIPAVSAHADSTASSTSQPIIQTSNTANGSSLSVQFPQNYSGEVTSTYSPTSGWQTTTTPLTQAQITAMNQQFTKEQQQMEQFFQEQQQFFEEQQNFFNSLWGN